jgi:hypothetical protein
VVSAPFGFTHVVDIVDRCDSTSTREPCARAATRADNRSGLLVTAAAFEGAATARAATGRVAICTVTTPSGTSKDAAATITNGRTAHHPRDGDEFETEANADAYLDSNTGVSNSRPP